MRLQLRVTTCALLFAGLSVLRGVTTFAQPEPADLAAWRQAVDEHAPGEQDHAARVISTWPTTTINVLIRDWFVLSKQWRTNRLDKIRRDQLYTLHISTAGDMARFVKRAAMLHADVAMLLPRHEPSNGDLSSGAATALLVGDGQQIGFSGVGSHWELGRTLLDTLPGAADDDMARRWYIATAAYLQAERNFAVDVPHLMHARELFPTDPQILFLSGVIHEFYASAEIQSAVDGMRANNPDNANRSLDATPTVRSSTVELQTAEELYRRAIVASPADAQLRLRHGRVTGLLGRHREAVATIAAIKPTLESAAMRYFACLFLGREQHQLKDLESARSEFREAAALFPAAQSPKFALSQIAAELGDRDGSIHELDTVVGRAPKTNRDHDPWVDYMFSHLQTLPALLRALYGVVPPLAGS